MPRALIAGCGYLGRATADLLHAAGWEVEGWTKSSEAADQLSDEPYVVKSVDVADRAGVMAQHGSFDVVIHCASTRGGTALDYRQTYLAGVGNLIDRFIGSTILLTSSTSVYAQNNEEWVTETSAAEPQHERGQILRATEQVVIKHGGIVARLGGIYGPGRSALLERFLAGRSDIDPGNDRFVNQVHRDDAAAAIALLLSRYLADDNADGQPAIFNVADDAPTRLSEIFAWLGTRLGPQPVAPQRPVPPRKRGDGNKRVSNARLRALGWEPRFPTFADGFEQSVLPHLAATRH